MSSEPEPGASHAMELLGSLRPSRAVITIYSVASIVGAFITFSSASGSFATMLVVAALATATALVVLLASQFLPWRAWIGHPWRVAATFWAVAVLAGAIRGWVLIEVSARWGIDLNSNSTAQLLNSVASALVWLTLAGLVAGARSRYQRRYRSLILRSVSEIDWDAHPSVLQVKRNVIGALDGASSSVGQPKVADLAIVAEAIRREIDLNIRPLSHRLWFGSDSEEPHARLSAVIRDAIGTWTVPMRVVLAVWFGTALLGTSRWLSVEMAPIVASASTLLLAVLLLMIRRFLPESMVIRGIGLVLGSVLVVIGSDAIVRVLGFPSRLFNDWPLLILLPIAMCALVVTAASIALAESDRRLVLEVAQHESQLVAQARRQSAYLHNSLQSELTGLAMQLEQAAQVGTPEGARSALERVHALLARSISEDFATLHEDPCRRIERVSEGWRGICAVTVDIDEEAQADPRLGTCVQAIEEVIANAVRHGQASTVTIRVESGAEALDVHCWSDSSAPESPGIGLGSQLLAAVAPGGLSREVVAGGTTLRFSIE